MSWPAQADCSSEIVMNKYFLLRLTLTWGVIYLPSLAPAADGRITLMLTGTTCRESHAALERKLLEVPGVRQINLHAVPDHVLIDVNTAVVDVELLATQVNAILATHPPCHATIMNSCISADLHVTSSLGSRVDSSIAQFGQ